MEEHVMKQKIQDAYSEPRAPENLVQSVILRAQAVSMGVQAQKELETATGARVGEYAARALIGQLAEVSELPPGIKPQQLAQHLEQEPAFRAALVGGNVLQRVKSGELMQQVTGQQPAREPEAPQISAPEKGGPAL